MRVRPPPVAAGADENARSPGRVFEPLGLQPALARPLLDEARHARFTRSSWNE
jgi:hypothetical protein